jgi:hypothetical protein
MAAVRSVRFQSHFVWTLSVWRAMRSSGLLSYLEAMAYTFACISMKLELTTPLAGIAIDREDSGSGSGKATFQLMPFLTSFFVLFLANLHSLLQVESDQQGRRRVLLLVLPKIVQCCPLGDISLSAQPLGHAQYHHDHLCTQLG